MSSSVSTELPRDVAFALRTVLRMGAGLRDVAGDAGAMERWTVAFVPAVVRLSLCPHFPLTFCLDCRICGRARRWCRSTRA